MWKGGFENIILGYSRIINSVNLVNMADDFPKKTIKL